MDGSRRVCVLGVNDKRIRPRPAGAPRGISRRGHAEVDTSRVRAGRGQRRLITRPVIGSSSGESGELSALAEDYPAASRLRGGPLPAATARYEHIDGADNCDYHMIMTSALASPGGVPRLSRVIEHGRHDQLPSRNPATTAPDTRPVNLNRAALPHTRQVDLGASLNINPSHALWPLVQ
jgi:hypothetical protein